MALRQITIADFLDGVQKGYITDIFALGTRVYGKDSRGKADSNELFDIVFCVVT